MSKLYFDSDKITNDCINKLLSTVSTLNSVSDSFRYMKIPYNFKYRSNLKNIKNDFSSYLTDVNKIYNWVFYMKKDFNNTISSLSDRKKCLPKGRFGVRKGL